MISITGKPKILLIVHEALIPYPPEHHKRYDLVRIHLLTAGLKQNEYAMVLTNARDLLSIYCKHR